MGAKLDCVAVRPVLHATVSLNPTKAMKGQVGLGMILLSSAAQLREEKDEQHCQNLEDPIPTIVWPGLVWRVVRFRVLVLQYGQWV